jgi:glycosyltransferase involved in cell wall biosynthesis
VRIACVVTQFPPNITAGLGRYIEEITPHLAGHCHLTVFTLNPGHQPVHERSGTVDVYRPIGRFLGAITRRRRLNRTRRLDFLLLAMIVMTSNARYFLRLWRTSRDERPALVAIHDSTNFLCGLLCHYLLRLPVVFHVHTTENGVAAQHPMANPLGAFAAVERWLGHIARRVVVATPELREQLVSAGWDPAAIDVICLGGTFERALADPGFSRDRLHDRAAKLRARLGIPSEDLVMLFVGRIERHKGIFHLLEAMRRITDAVPRVWLVVVGEGDTARAERIVADTGLAETVLFSGGFIERQELLDYYEMADACVFPSILEPFGLVATEAMAMAKPTILGEGFSRLFVADPDQPAVRFVRGTDPDDIARTMIEVMTDPALCHTLAERGHQFARERLNWARTADETFEVYRVATSSPHSGLSGS